MRAYKFYLIESILIVLAPAIANLILFFPSYLRASQQIPMIMLSWIILLPGLIYFGFTIFPSRGRDVYHMVKDIRGNDITSKQGTVLDYKVINRFSIISGKAYELAIREKDTGLTKIFTGLKNDLGSDIQLNDDVEIHFLKSAEVITQVQLL